MRNRDPDNRYVVTEAGFLFCQDCGSLVMEGYRNEHDRLHPRAGCEVVHPETFVIVHKGGHDWIEQFGEQP